GADVMKDLIQGTSNHFANARYNLGLIRSKSRTSSYEYMNEMPAPTRYAMVVSVKPEAAGRLTRSRSPPQNPGRFDDWTSRLASRRPAIAPVSTMVPRTSGSAPTRSKLRYRTRLIRRAGAATGITRLRHSGAIDSHDGEATMANALSDKERVMIDAYWRAANY